jgi:hypothetical protein
MRSTRATAAVARLNQRSAGRHYVMVITSNSHFVLRERVDGVDKEVSEPLGLDEFVRFVNGQGTQIVPRVTKNDAAFARQLVKKT